MGAMAQKWRWNRFKAPLVLALGVVASAAVALGAPAQQAPRQDRVVARVGTEEITVGELEEQLRAVPAFQLRRLGATRAEIRRAFLDQVIAQELWVQAARAEGLEQRSDVSSRIRAIQQGAMVKALQAEVAGEQVSDAQVEAYYREHQDEFRAQKRIQIWQIVLASREAAERLLETVRTDPAYQKNPVKRWGQLAAEHSLDKTTSERNGNLGFVRPDGSTAHKGVKVDPAIYRAAERVGRAEVVPEPIEVGDRWVVVQRRDSHTTPDRPLEMVAPTIRAQLGHKRYEKELKSTIARLRTEHARDLQPQLVGLVRVDPSTQEIRPPRRPGTLPRRPHPAAGSPQPIGQPGYLR